jgi:hypothetical protein
VNPQAARSKRKRSNSRNVVESKSNAMQAYGVVLVLSQVMDHAAATTRTSGVGPHRLLRTMVGIPIYDVLLRKRVVSL